MFFDTPQVKRAWIRVEELVKFERIDQPPRCSTSTKPGLKVKWKKILAMAAQCSHLSREQRLEQFSFAALFDGKWGYYDENTTKVERKKKVQLDNESSTTATNESKPVIKDWKPSDLLNLWHNNQRVERVEVDEWMCNMCHKYYPYVENIIVKHLKFHHMNIEVIGVKVMF